jgi:hypothetical protein
VSLVLAAQAGAAGMVGTLDQFDLVASRTVKLREKWTPESGQFRSD